MDLFIHADGVTKVGLADGVHFIWNVKWVLEGDKGRGHNEKDQLYQAADRLFMWTGLCGNAGGCHGGGSSFCHEQR